jgi:hypothetical protein
MVPDFSRMPSIPAIINAAEPIGPFEWWRHSVGQGGINHHPLPPRVVDAVRNLRPGLIRIFIQQFFDIYPRRGVFNWERLDPYMGALADTGAMVLASITIKPPPLYPSIDQKIWRPNDPAEWQNVISKLVKRYSVDRAIVSHWGIGNETDIGEHGGCPYLIPDPAEFSEYYALTAKPILETFPKAKIGGPSASNGRHALIAGLLDHCGRTGLPLDFISWNIYSNDPAAHADLARYNAAIARNAVGTPPETMITEWNKCPSAWGNPPVSVEEQAFASQRAVAAAMILLSYIRAGASWTFYYHLWDQVAYEKEFAAFFKDPYLMVRHWNELPHRLGLFGVGGEVRPQYFVFWMLSHLGDELLYLSDENAALPMIAARSGESVAAMCINPAEDRIVNCEFTGLRAGPHALAVYRIDNERRWNADTCEPIPVEQRVVDGSGGVARFQVWAPGKSVVMVKLGKA